MVMDVEVFSAFTDPTKVNLEPSVSINCTVLERFLPLTIRFSPTLRFVELMLVITGSVDDLGVPGSPEQSSPLLPVAPVQRCITTLLLSCPLPLTAPLRAIVE